ncbi:MAG: hypothetical protein VB124_01835 [Burkholderia sp.]
MASRKTGLQVTPRSPSGSTLATCRLIVKSCLNNRIRYTFALPEIMYIGLASSSRSIYATTPLCGAMSL